MNEDSANAGDRRGRSATTQGVSQKRDAEAPAFEGYAFRVIVVESPSLRSQNATSNAASRRRLGLRNPTPVVTAKLEPRGIRLDAGEKLGEGRLAPVVER